MFQTFKCGPGKGNLTKLKLKSATGGDALNFKECNSPRPMNEVETGMRDRWRCFKLESVASPKTHELSSLFQSATGGNRLKPAELYASPVASLRLYEGLSLTGLESGGACL